MALFTTVLSTLAGLSAGHRPMVNGVSCGAQFSTADDAIFVHDITIEWSMNRVVTCDGPMLWTTFEVPESLVSENRQLYISAGSLHVSNGNDRASRFNEVRVDAALLGPGLPTLDRTGLPAHAEIPESFETGRIFQSPADQSTCAHSEWLGAMEPSAAVVEEGVCSFYENFGRTWQTVLLDVTPEVAAAGTHHVAAWLQAGTSGKFWFAVGVVGGTEDFISQFDIPTGRCACGVDPSTFMDDVGGFAAVGISTATFYEKPDQEGVVPDDAPPEVMQCSGSPAITDYCGAGGGPPGGAEGGEQGGAWGGAQGNEDADRPSAQADHGMSMGCGQIDGCASSERLVAAGVDMHGYMAIPFSGDVALDFVRGMIPHHQGAVDMCAILLSAGDSTDSGLVHFCDHVQQEQGIELAVMQGWLAESRPNAGTVERCADMSSMGCGDLTGDAAGEWQAANHRMHMGMSIRFECDAQVDFVRGMIPHHQGAIEMCEILTMYGDEDSQLTELCDNITRVQRSEIMWMSNWLVNREVERTALCSDSATAPPMPCEDLFSVSDSCHHFGGDLRCRCSDLIQEYECGTVAELPNERTINVSSVCQRTCGGCPERMASPVGTGMDGMDHSNHHDHSNHDQGSDNEDSNQATVSGSASLAITLSTAVAMDIVLRMA